MIRVPVPNGSLVILNLESERLSTSNKCHYEKNMEGELVEQIKYSTNNELVLRYRWYICSFNL
jgi:glyceraldehyde 3-phosphate dehydrogenase